MHIFLVHYYYSKHHNEFYSIQHYHPGEKLSILHMNIHKTKTYALRGCCSSTNTCFSSSKTKESHMIQYHVPIRLINSWREWIQPNSKKTPNSNKFHVQIFFPLSFLFTAWILFFTSHLDSRFIHIHNTQIHNWAQCTLFGIGAHTYTHTQIPLCQTIEFICFVVELSCWYMESRNDNS